MATIEDKLKVVESKFRRGFKGYEAARYIVRANREIPEDEKKAICGQIPIAPKTLEGVFTKLRKLELYPPQKTEDIPKHPSTPEEPKETGEVIEAPRPPQQEYATKEDFLILKNSINYIAALMSKDVPSNPDELASVMRGEALSNPDESEEEKYIEMQPGELFIHEGSRLKQSIWVKPKIQILYDSTKDGFFGDYPGTRDTDPFDDWKKDGESKIKITWSDFVNIIVEEFYLRLYHLDLELTTRRRL